MRKLFMIILVLITPVAFAAEQQTQPLNQITMQLSAEKWVSTNTAKVVVSVDASVDKIKLENMRQEISSKLAKISNNGKWYITRFNRSQDQSGLERIRVEAQARLPANALADLRAKAKAISQPGETYRVKAILFSPSFTDIQQADAALRQQIYADAKAELARVNKLYPKQGYFIHSINFVAAPSPGPMVRKMELTASIPKTEPLLPVSTKLHVTATVVLAAPSKAD